MNKVFFDGKLSETPRIMGNDPDPKNNWGLIKFWHKDGEDANGNPRMSYRTVWCSAKTVQYLLDMGWGKGDTIFVEGSERIEKNTDAEGREYTNVVIYNAQVSCGLKKGDTLQSRRESAGNTAAPTSAAPPVQQAAPQTPQQAPPAAQEPRSMAELEEEFDEESMVID